jgi:tetratricopeptide (TPR) repeat protein
MRRGWMALILALLMLVVFGCADKFVTSGKISMNARNWDKAISDFTKALEVNPANAPAHFYLGKVYKEKGDFTQMAIHLNAADSLDPKFKTESNKLRDDAWFAVAASADSSMNEVPALEKDATAYFEKAMQHQSAGQPDSATKYFNQTKASLRIRDNARAEALFNQAVDKAKAGETNEASYIFADSVLVAATSGIYETAKNKFETAIFVSPHRPEAYAKAGFAWFRLAKDDSSFYYYRQAYNRAPENMEILGNLVRMAAALGESEMVDSLAAKVLEKDPSNVEALVRRGEIADQAGRYEDAVKYYNAAIEKKPEQCNIWFNLGVIYFQKMQKLDDAEQAFTQAAKLCPDDANTMINLNVVLITNNKLDEAITHLNTFTASNPNDCVGWDLLSQALLRKGQKEQALAANKKYEDCKKGQ